MIIGTTGHRHLVGNNFKEDLRSLLLEHKPTKVIQGMAYGFDHIVGYMCVELKIPFVAALPFNAASQTKFWGTINVLNHENLMRLADEVVIVSPGPYARRKYAIRNKWIVDRCDLLIAYYDGKGNSGTAQCVEYALSLGKRVVNVYDGIHDMSRMR